jgi:hypothetical protein
VHSDDTGRPVCGRARLASLAICLTGFLLPLSTAVAQQPLRVSPAQFHSLAWLEGRWRGRTDRGQWFYESYALVNDSTLATHTYPDSTFAAPTDSSEIRLRGSEVVSQSGRKRWLAAALDSSHVRFVPVAGARNTFTWRRQSPDVWTATLRWPAKIGRRTRTVVYRMERVARASPSH